MAIKANLLIDQGADYQTTIDVTDDDGNPIILTGYTGSAQMRKHFTSLSSYDFVVTITANTGAVAMTMNSAITGAISAGRYVYDCELVNTSNVVSRLIEGVVTVTPQVTRQT